MRAKFESVAGGRGGCGQAGGGGGEPESVGGFGQGGDSVGRASGDAAAKSA